MKASLLKRTWFLLVLVSSMSHPFITSFRVHYNKCLSQVIPNQRSLSKLSSLSLSSSHANNFFYHEVIHESTISGARVGRIHTPHGVVDTPGFVAVATNGALKGVSMKDADDAGQQLIFCNSYHLMLQPGPDIIKEAGGLHKFMHRPNGPIITDSGGFQIFSLKHGSVHQDIGALNDPNKNKLQSELKCFKPKQHRKRSNYDSFSNNDFESSSSSSSSSSFDLNGFPNSLREGFGMNDYLEEEGSGGGGSSVLSVSEEGVTFRSYRDGKKILLTPESTIRAQKAYQSDIIIPLDELPPYHTSEAELLKSVELSHRWEERSLKEHLLNIQQQAIYGVIHGGVNKQIRMKSIDYLTKTLSQFNGYAIGGSLGCCHEELVDLLSFILPKLPKEKPNHLLGIADEKSILAAVPLGVDTFDSCFPTKLARHGTVLTKLGKLHVSNAACAKKFKEPIERDCGCSTCLNYDLAYLHHLKKAAEPLLWQLASIHNIWYMNNLMEDIRKKILLNQI